MRRLGAILLFLFSCSATMLALHEGDNKAPEAMYGKALNSYQLACNGDAEAQCQLASCYHSGYGVEENDSLAFVWAMKSAEQDYPAGLYFLAYCYETGKGCSVNMGKANSLYKKAYEMAMLQAYFGEPSAQFVIGKIFDYGNGGVAQNQEVAVRWYRRAAKQGCPGAQFNLGSEASLQGDADAQYMLGLCYAAGEGVAKNVHKAKKWLKEASRQGHKLAQNILMRIRETW